MTIFTAFNTVIGIKEALSNFHKQILDVSIVKNMQRPGTEKQSEPKFSPQNKKSKKKINSVGRA